jgi:outer membrane cobalamin receptor
MGRRGRAIAIRKPGYLVSGPSFCLRRNSPAPESARANAEGGSMPCPVSGRSGRVLPLIFHVVIFSLAVCTAAFADTLRGRVLDPDGRPVAGADVIILRAEVVVTSTKTLADGRFGPVDLPSGEYEILASAPGLRAASKRVQLSGETLQTDISTSLSAQQESVVVSAGQVDVPLSRVTDTVTVIDRSELDLKHTDTVSDALRLVPGFGIVQSGGRGAVTSIFPRGGESDYTLVLVDGIPQNAFGGGYDAAHLATSDVDRIEVVHGPESALYGDGAIGGIVHVITRNGGPARAQVSVEGGGYGLAHTSASTSGSQGAWRWGGSIDHLTTDGDTRERANLGRRVANADYARTEGSVSLGWSDRPGRSVRVDVRGDSDDRGFPGPYGSDPLQLYSGLDLVSRGHNTSTEVGVSGTFASGASLQHRAQFTWADLKSHFVSPPFGCNPTDCPLPPDTADDETGRISGRYQFDLERRSIGVSGGFELLRERVDNTFITGEEFQPVPIKRFVSGWFAEARPSIGQRGFLTAGLRVERIEREALEGNPGSRPTFDNDVVWSVNPKVSMAWFLRGTSASSWTKLRGSAGTGIKPPTGFELAFTDNPDLKPERSRSFDFGVEQAIGGTALVADVTWFHNRYDDLIVTLGRTLSGASRYQSDNIANARAQGLETGLRWQSRSGFAARAGYTWLSTEVLGVDNLPSAAPLPYAVGDPLVRRPKNQAFGELTYSRNHLTGFVTVNGRGAMADLEPNFASTLVTNPGYATTAFGASYTLARHVEVFGRVTNAFDRSYEEAYGFPALGRTASLGIRVAAGR